MSFNLFDLTLGETKLLSDMVEQLEAGGMETQTAIEAAVAKIDDLTQDKIMAYVSLIKNWQSQVEALTEAGKTMIERASGKAKAIDRLKERMTELLPHDKKWEGIEGKVSFRRSEALTVELDALNVLPAEFIRIIPESVQADKTKLKEAVKAGQKFPGVTITENWNIQIK